MFGKGQDIMGLYEQKRVLVIATKVLFYTENDLLRDLPWNPKPSVTYVVSQHDSFSISSN